jgi:hypothetical protein
VTEKFEPGKHLRPMKGGAEYLDVKWRLVWLRQEHPDAEIETRALEHEPGKWAAFIARVALPGKGSATGHGSETAADFRDYYEKAETKALGRALAALGYGTQFVGDELDEGQRIVDAPVQRPAPRAQERPAPAPPAAPVAQTARAEKMDSWTTIWQEARAQGIKDRDALAAFLGQNPAGMEPRDILAKLRDEDTKQPQRPLSFAG